MGLDMYIYEDTGVEATDRELCYWREHPDLHGYITQYYAGGVDNCQKVPLTREVVLDILLASEDDRLPKTEGFFFGESTPGREDETYDQLVKLLAKMDEDPGLKIYYRAGW